MWNSSGPHGTNRDAGFQTYRCRERVDVYVPDTKVVETAISNMNKDLKDAVTNSLSEPHIQKLTEDIETLKAKIKELENKLSEQNTKAKAHDLED